MPRKGFKKSGAVGPDTISTVERERRCLELRQAGVSLDVIAQQVGFSNRGGVYKAIIRGLQRTLQEPADGVRTLECLRLDRALQAVWPGVLRGDIKSIYTFLNIHDRRCLLLGLRPKEPLQLEISGPEQGPVRIEANDLTPERIIDVLSILRELASQPGVAELPASIIEAEVD